MAEVDFTGNELFSDAVLALRTRTRPNRRFLGIPGFTWWLWLYRLGASGSLGERAGQALMASGEAPAFLDESVVAADVERLRLFYLQEGFRDVAVEARIDTVAAEGLANVTFVVVPGAPTYVRDVRYEGVEALAPEQRARIVRGSLLHAAGERTALPPGAALSFTARDRRYSEPVLHQERRRLMMLLRDEGYAAVTRDSIRALVYPQAPDSFDVVFRIRTGPRFRFGGVHFEVEGPEPEAALRTDTIAVAAPDTLSEGGRITFRIRNERKLDPELLVRTLRFRPGDWYSQADLLATKRRLEATGLFLFTDITPLVADTFAAGPSVAPRLPHRFDLRTRRRHQIRVETFMVQRSGVIGGTDDELGTGLGLSYQNADLFGGGETFRLSTTGSIAADMSSLFEDESDETVVRPEDGLFTSAQAEVTGSLTFPYLAGPLRPLERSLRLYDARTRLSLSYLTARRADLGLTMRGRGTARVRLEMQHTPTLSSLVDVLDVSLSNPDADSAFLGRLLQYVVDPVQRAQIREDYTQPQVNTALRYTLRSANVNPLTRDRGYSYEGGVEFGSNLAYLFDRFVFSPGRIEGSLPGIPLFLGSGEQDRLVYRQYLRLVTDLRRYRPVDRNVVLALKFIGGVAHPTGRADVVPFDRRFYSGGSSSVRGWGLRELGPGGTGFITAPDAAGEVSNLLGGEVKLEASAELRTRLLRNILAADWIGVTFVDAGNVWLGPRNPGLARTEPDAGGPDGRFRLGSFYEELGIGTGLGLRLAWEYLIVRFDLAAKVHDPTRPGEGFFPDGLGSLQPHFGIGHTF